MNSKQLLKLLLVSITVKIYAVQSIKVSGGKYVPTVCFTQHNKLTPYNLV